MARAAGLIAFVALLAAGLAASGAPLLPAYGETPPDPYDGDPAEWEHQIAADARGDVLIRWPGSTDLLYMTLGELYSVARMESYLFIRIGYNITDPGEETVYIPEVPMPVPGLPAPPASAPPFPLVMVNASFMVNEDRRVDLSMWSQMLGRFWGTDQGQLVADNKRENGDREIIFVAPLRRFGLQADDELSGFNVTSYRNGRLVDTMQGFDAASDYLPFYPPVKPLLYDPGSLVPPQVGDQPLPPVPPLPDPGLPPGTDPREAVPDQPYPNPPDPLPLGLPKGTPHPGDLNDWDPDRDGPLPWDPDTVVGDATEFLEDPGNGFPWNTTHRIRDREARFIVRPHQQMVPASLTKAGFANFTIENLMHTTDQNVGLFFSGPPNMRWFMRYALDMPSGVKTLPAGGRIDMGFIAAPESLFSRPQWGGSAIFISEWGGIEVEPLLFVSTTERVTDPRLVPGREIILPERLSIGLVNPDDVFRVNEPRQIMVRVQDANTLQYVSQLSAVRAYVYPVAAGVPNSQPFQLREKPWMDGVYQIPYTFDRPGAWYVDVYFFDYPPGRAEGFPHESFIVFVDIPGRAPPLMPTLAAIGTVFLVVGTVWARERIAKAR